MSDKTENPFEKYGPWFESKKSRIEDLLGEMHELTGNSIFPWSRKSRDGLLDMFYFCNAIPGTGMASMQLCNESDAIGNSWNTGAYELLAFTREQYIKHDNPQVPFNRAERRLCHIFSKLATLSLSSELEPGDTCEIPVMRGNQAAYLILDEYLDQKTGNKCELPKLMLVIEVFEDEMHFAQEHGVVALVELLKEKGHYPYSDKKRSSVLK